MSVYVPVYYYYIQRLLESGPLNSDWLSAFAEILPNPLFEELGEHVHRLLPDEATEDFTYGPNNLEGYLQYILESPNLSRQIRQVYLDLFRKSDPAPGQNHHRLPAYIEERLAEVIELVGLDDEGHRILHALYCWTLPLFDERTVSDDSQFNIELLSRLTGVHPSSVRELLSDQSPLLSFELVEPRNRYSSAFEINQQFRHDLEYPGKASSWEKLLEKDSGSTFALDSFSVRNSELETLLSILDDGVPSQILFYGSAGTGKTELARALAHNSGRELIFVNPAPEGEVLKRRLALERAVKMHQGNVIICVDEADALLNVSPGFFFFAPMTAGDKNHEKAWLNQFLERNQVTTIWITNDKRAIPESVRRRFHYSVPFQPLSGSQRLKLWRTILEGHPLAREFDDDYIRLLAQNFPVNAAGIHGSLSYLKAMRKRPRGKRFRSRLEELLKSRSRVLHGKSPKIRAQNNEPFFPEFLEASVDLSALKSSIENHLNSESDRGQHLLFYGPPGTGKTKWIQKMSYEIAVEVHVHRASSLLSPFVGMSERQIREAFEKAESARAILIIDEVDSFLMDRSRAHRSWETTMVNEFLDAMESFTGVLACTSNRIDDMDPAAIRRFRQKVEFRPLSADNSWKMFQAYFRHYYPRAKIKPEEKESITALKGVTPSDFAVVFENLESRTAQSLKPGEIADALRKEVKLRRSDSGPIGFR